MRLIRRTLFIFLGIGALVLGATPIIANTVIPSGPFKFTPLFKNDVYALDIDQSTVFSTVDEEGDTLVGAAVRLVPTRPTEANGTKISTYINAVIAICGHDGIIMVQSNLFDENGKLLLTENVMSPLPITSPNSPTAVIYKHLCRDAPRNNGPRGYNPNMV